MLKKYKKTFKPEKLYGMNFENMSELKWQYGYYGIWGIMIAVMTGMVIYFKKKKWL